MNLEKLKYSKCPNCKKHGIPGVLKAGRYPYTLTCKHCEKKYKMNSALVVIINIFAPITGGIICLLVDNHIVNIPLLLYMAVALILHALAMYFAPLEEVDE